MGGYFHKKVKETIEIKQTTLNDTSLSLSTRHSKNSLRMSRIYKDESGSNTNKSNLEESNNMVDAILAHVSKLDNIPSFNLIEKGNIMITYKEKPIQISKDIFLKIDEVNISPDGSVDSLKMSLLSNTLSAAEITTYAKNIYKNYLEEMKNSLGNKVFFFDQKSKESSNPPPLPTEQDQNAILAHKRMLISTAPKQLCFTMLPFHSNKKFSNLFGDEIRLIEKRIRFFLDNKEWYDSRGIPYQLGMLLSGVPGAGKTSCIRAISNITKRHIINVNFANITTATQLKNLFYSDKIQVYTDQSMSIVQTYHIPIDQRIYVLEEIDAIGDIVKQRNPGEKSDSNITVNDELNLMEILTVLDGTMEIPGRIFIMTTNHPEVLDAALIRPGRVDVNVKFGYANKEIIAEMFMAYFDIPFPNEHLHELPDNILTPAEISEVLFRNFDTRNVANVISDLCHISNNKMQHKTQLSTTRDVTSDVTSGNVPGDNEEKTSDVTSDNVLGDDEEKTSDVTRDVTNLDYNYIRDMYDKNQVKVLPVNNQEETQAFPWHLVSDKNKVNVVPVAVNNDTYDCFESVESLQTVA
jgi:SpoVK/Ycf46/Vps4 family AAA+-type ATPase